MIDKNRIQDSITNRFLTIASDEAFKSDKYFETVYSEYSIKHLSYSVKDSFKNDGEQVFSINNAPSGFPFVPGKKYPYIEFAFAVNGNELYLSQLGNSTEFRVNDLVYNSRNSQKYFVFYKYSPIPFIGNDELLEQTNNEAKSKKEFIELAINNFNKEADETNILLREFTQKEFLKEKEKRELKKSSMDKLSPF